MTTKELIDLLMMLDGLEDMGVYVKNAGKILPLSKVYIEKEENVQFLVIE